MVAFTSRIHRFTAVVLVLACTMVVHPKVAAATPVPPTVANMYDSNLAFPKIDKVHVMGESFNMHYISTVTVSGTIYAYYIVHKPGDLFATGLATSTDGLNWTNHGTVVDNGPAGSWDSRLASFPGIAYVNGTFYLVYEGAGTTAANPGDVGLATSTDGVNFAKNAGPLLTHQTTGWESTNIGTPSLVYEANTWYLFYHGFNGSIVQIGVASGSSLTSLSRGANPIVPAGPAGAWDAGTAGKRDIVKHGSYYYMAYEGSTEQPYDTAKWSSGLARASSLLGPWTKYSQNPVLPQVNGFGNDGPTFLTVGGNEYLYYRSVGGSGSVTRRALFADEATGGLGQSYNAATSPNHIIGSAVSGAWRTTTSDGSNFATYGPYTTATPVDWATAVFKLSIDNNVADSAPVATLDVYDATTGTEIVTRTIKRNQFTAANHAEYFIVPFWNSPALAGHQLEFRTNVVGNATLSQTAYGTD